MKKCILDTDVLSEFFKGNDAVVKRVDEYLKYLNTLNITIITFYEVLKGLEYFDAKKRKKDF